MPEYVTLILKSILRPESDQSSEINQSVLLELSKENHVIIWQANQFRGNDENKMLTVLDDVPSKHPILAYLLD